MTNKEITRLAQALADTLAQTANVDERMGILVAKDAIADLMFEHSYDRWSFFNAAWNKAFNEAT